jgi:hypothetical protein
MVRLTASTAVMAAGRSTGDRIIRKMMMGSNMVSPTFLHEGIGLDVLWHLLIRTAGDRIRDQLVVQERGAAFVMKGIGAKSVQRRRRSTNFRRIVVFRRQSRF